VTAWAPVPRSLSAGAARRGVLRGHGATDGAIRSFEGQAGTESLPYDRCLLRRPGDLGERRGRPTAPPRILAGVGAGTPIR